jgi:hypothetical protein
MTFDMPEKISSSNFLKEKGKYHVVVTAYDLEPRNKNNELIEGFTVDFEVLEGTVRHNNICTEVGKTYQHTFYNVAPNDSEKQKERKNAQRAAFYIATELATKADLGKQIKFDINDCLNRQCVIELQFKNKKDDVTGEWIPTEFLEIAYANIWAVDDRYAAATPKDIVALKIIGKEHAATNGAPATAKSATNGTAKAASTKTSATKQEPATAAAKNDDWNV